MKILNSKIKFNVGDKVKFTDRLISFLEIDNYNTIVNPTLIVKTAINTSPDSCSTMCIGLYEELCPSSYAEFFIKNNRFCHIMHNKSSLIGWYKGPVFRKVK